ncbi:MAG TPA: efflux RND transporter periplasmic adaptor subunit [Vicinamibacterales bacterium]|jgi:RND family efflux transporter MFP subunit
MRPLHVVTAALVAAGVIAIVVARDRAGDSHVATSPAPPDSGPHRQAVTLDGRRQQLAGVRAEPVTRGTIARVIHGVGPLILDETRLTDINVKLDGWIRELYVNYTGQEVRRGNALFALYSQELVGAQLQYLAALRAREQLTPAQAADRDYQERLIETPRKRLQYWDFPEDQLRALEKGGQALDAVIFRSPADGMVIEKMATKGMHVQAGQTLYRLADMSFVWIDANVNPADLLHVRAGQKAAVTIAIQPEERISGRVLHVFPAVSESSKSARLRIEVPNKSGQLRPGMFASVDIEVDPEQGLVVPEDAVIDSGRRHTVFVATGNGRFEPRDVDVGLHADNRYLVRSGLTEGEEVVTRSTFMLDSESQLSAALHDYSSTSGPKVVSSNEPQAALSFLTDPSAARIGKNQLEVQLLGADRAPLTDAVITVQFYMAPMPSMNMPAMRADSRLEHVGAGVYRGTGTFSMAGPWDVTVVASRNGTQIAEKRLSVVVAR